MNKFKKLLFWDLIKGLNLTAKQMLARKTTIQYPEEQTPKSPRFRGLHALRCYPNGAERCVACKLCASVCPTAAITIESHQSRTDEVRRASKFDLDLAKCMFCGLCEEACPVDAIVETDCSNYHFEDRKAQILTKARLLAIGRDDVIPPPTCGGPPL